MTLATNGGLLVLEITFSLSHHSHQDLVSYLKNTKNTHRGVMIQLVKLPKPASKNDTLPSGFPTGVENMALFKI